MKKVEEDTLDPKEAFVLEQLESKFGLLKKDLDQAIRVEKTSANPASKITNIVEAIEFYNSHALSAYQLMFLAINAKSRSNMYQNHIEKLIEDLKKKEIQVETLMLLTRDAIASGDSALNKPTEEEE